MSRVGTRSRLVRESFVGERGRGVAEMRVGIAERRRLEKCIVGVVGG